MVKQLSSLGFIVHDEDKYTKSSDYLRRGGILVTPGAHTCMVLDNGKKYYPRPALGKLKILHDLNVRDVPVTGEVINVMREGDVVYYYGTDPATGWFELYNGYCSNKEKYTEVHRL